MAEHSACPPLNAPCAPQHLLKCSFDVVKRWVNEAQEAASSDNIMVQVSKAVILKILRLVALSWPDSVDSYHRDPGGPWLEQALIVLSLWGDLGGLGKESRAPLAGGVGLETLLAGTEVSSVLITRVLFWGMRRS